MSETNEKPSESTPPENVTCGPNRDPAVRLFIASAMFIGFAIYCFVDAVPAPEAWSLEHINPATEYVLHIGGPWVFGLAGIIPLVFAILFLKRTLTADKDGIGFSDGEKIPWSSITKLDATDLKSKGILALHYTTEGSREGKIKLDDWKLNNFRDLMAIVENNVPKNIQDIR